jgi:hypothetical protein
LWIDLDKICNLYRGPSIDASYQVSVYLGKRFQRRRFCRNRPSTKSSSLKPLSQMNQNLVRSIIGMSSIKIANFVLIRLQTWLRQAIIVSECILPSFCLFDKAVSEEKIFRNWPIRNNNCLSRSCL